MTAAKPPAAAKKKPAAKKAPPIEAEAVVIEREEKALVVGEFQSAGEIEANFDDVKRHIDGILDEYRGAQITRPYLKQAKKDRAYANSLAKSLDQKRLDVKRVALRPIEAFESKVKELIAPIKTVSEEIDVQIKAIEAEMKAEKLEALVDYWLDFAGILADVVRFETISDDRWLNATVDLETAKLEIEAIVRKILVDEETLSSLGLKYENDAKATYFATLDLSAAINRSKELEAQADAAAAVQAEKDAYEAARAAETAGRPAEEPVDIVADLDRIDEVIGREETPSIAWLLRFTCTREELAGVLEYLKSVGITGRAGRDNGGS